MDASQDKHDLGMQHSRQAGRLDTKVPLQFQTAGPARHARNRRAWTPPSISALNRERGHAGRPQRGGGKRTWKETAEKRPRHMNCETLTSTASVHDTTIVSAAPGAQQGAGWGSCRRGTLSRVSRAGAAVWTPAPGPPSGGCRCKPLRPAVRPARPPPHPG